MNEGVTSSNFRIDAQDRRKKIIAVSVTGIVTNLFLGILKAVLGVLSGSVALVSDALNNITDSSSSLITIIGTKLAGKAPDKQHPFGHGRTEYLTSLLIGGIVFLTGFQSLISSAKAVLHKEEMSTGIVTVIIIIATIVAKIILGTYTQNSGIKYNSGALQASGADAKNDAIVSVVTLISTVVYIFTKISIDGIAGVIISLFILKAAYDILSDTIKKLLGERVDGDMVRGIKEIARSTEGVINCFDLILNDYGPDFYTGSINVEIEDNRSIGEMYPILHEAQTKIYDKYNVFLVFGFYAVDVKDERYKKIKALLQNYKDSERHIINYHGIVIDEKDMTIYCDITKDFDIVPETIIEDVNRILKAQFPQYDIHVNIDTEFTGE
ncbi:cation diffusion facilitator family transporter [Lachnoanaerobaculum saburreum]|uniref:Cation diffusion facilitator family transporter n=1 Tax=Lachnoanaerobaculum saburreum TaxID=467210 RepID=A0A133ZZE6_9FIRM|nr:cation diffusion facilitator family transporter [Lachnoanaerobaculum saburreum]KXB60800.1 cation diffusion facilitator family transporter [Lachnoanaerobaculum saburreum]